MILDLGKLSNRDRYKLLAGSVVPRPIAWVTTVDDRGHVNLAPFSFFQVMGTSTPTIGIGISDHDDGRRKDTLRAIETTGTFVVSLTSMELVGMVDASSAEYPHGTNEAEELGIELVASPSTHVPRVEAAPAAFECSLVTIMPVGPDESWVVGAVTHAFIRDDIISNRGRIDYGRYQPLGRLVGDLYVRTDGIFSVDRSTGLTARVGSPGVGNDAGGGKPPGTSGSAA